MYTNFHAMCVNNWILMKCYFFSLLSLRTSLFLCISYRNGITDKSQISDKTLPDDERQRLLAQIESKLDEKPTKSFGPLSHRHRTGTNDGAEVIVTNGMQPTLEYEQLRRRIRSNIMEMYNYAGSEWTKMWKNHVQVPEFGDDYMERVLQMTNEQKRALLNDMDEMQRIDGYEQWRRKEADSLSDLVQRRLTHLQNPADCSRARKLICRLNKVGGIKRLFWH